MNKRTQHSVYSDHDEVLLLLPWFANSTLDKADLEKVRNHLKVCLTCRRELASFEMLASNLEREPAWESSYKPSFERLMVKIRQEQGAATAMAGSVPRQRWLERLGGWIAQWAAPRYLVPALATVTVAAVVPFLLRSEGVGSWPEPVYQTLAMPGSMAKFADSDVQVVFSDGVSRQEITGLIAAVQGELLEGPSPRGIYTVRIRSGRDLQASLAQLRQDERVVFAEPVLGPDLTPKK